MGMGKRRRHAVIFKAARRVKTLMLQVQASWLAAGKLGHAVRWDQQRLALANGYNLFRPSKRQQIVKPPNAA